MTMPQLRVRTGYTYRDVYGKHSDVMKRLKEIGCDRAAIVDFGTWGHVRYEQAAKKAGVKAMFGMEFPILIDDLEDPMYAYKPRAWILAEDTRRFYNATSKAIQNGGLPADEFGKLPGVTTFCGAAIDRLADHEFDYIDINPASFVLAAKGIRRHRSTGKPIVITSGNDMPGEEHCELAYSWEVKDSVSMRHIASEDELWSQLRHIMTRKEFDEGVKNSHAIADSLNGIELAKAPLIHMEGNLPELCREGQASRLARGHIKEWTEEYEARLVMELEQIQLKKFDSYFLVVADLIRHAKTIMIVGPARGSSAGSLLCYLIGITEVDPIPHRLLFQRFVDISRADLPDIDIDFPDTKRHLCFSYLQEKYGIENVVKLGNINTLKALSVMAQVGKKFGIGIGETDSIRNAVIEYSSADERYGKGLEDTLMQTAPGKEFTGRHPDAARCMGELELHPSHSGVHAAGIVVCNEKVTDYCTVTSEGVAQVDKVDSEYLNLLKIDALGLRTLGIIEDAGVVTGEQLYSLTLDDPAVLNVLNDDRVSGIFQFEGSVVRSVMRLVNIDHFSKIDNITALARPGPLSSGMAIKYIDRVAGKEPIKYDVPQLAKYLDETFGVFVYQEQIMSVVKEIGLFDWVKTSAIRKAMSGRKGEEYFNSMGADFCAGALQVGVPTEKAQKIWKEMVTFGAWGFNKSHSVSYAIVTYWTCYLKCYHKLEFAAACLRSAKDNEQTIAILRELSKEGVEYTAIDPELSGLNWKAVDGRLVGGILNAKGYGPVKSLKYINDRDAGTLTQKQKDNLAKAENPFADLNEAHTKWGHYYANPSLIGVSAGSKIVNMKSIDDREEGVFIGKLVKKVLSDENEPIRVKKRGGSIWKGETRFIDLMMIDDSTDTFIRCRIRPEKYVSLGLGIAENSPIGSWFLMRGWKIPELDMFILKNIKQLTKEESNGKT